MKPKRIDVERAAEAIRTKKDWRRLAMNLTMDHSPSGNRQVWEIYCDDLEDAAIRLLLRESERVVKAVRKQYRAPGHAEGSPWFDATIGTERAFEELNVSRRSRAARVRKEEKR